ncbi:hypothetical protein LCGC14_2336880 [marine sediment metagenome]|uniref:Uncharacterized protein n=1 Tax=marine sediment metagenome TaxID=412755 RepID=A0A0F9ER17_9ZZZZ
MNVDDEIYVRIIIKYTSKGKFVSVDDYYIQAKVISVIDDFLEIRFQEAPLYGVVSYVQNIRIPHMVIEHEIPTMSCI